MPDDLHHVLLHPQRILPEPLHGCPLSSGTANSGSLGPRQRGEVLVPSPFTNPTKPATNQRLRTLASIFHEESDKVTKRRLTPLLTCDDACASLHQCNHQKVRALTTIAAGQ